MVKNSPDPLLLAVFLSLATAEVTNAATFEKSVLCATQTCGTMKISTYAAFERTTISGAKVGGVEIAGAFQGQQSGDFRYLQAVTVDDAPLAFIDGTELAVPYVDPPPGGYWRQPFDLLPFYDEGEFPLFYDRPQNLLDSALGGRLTVQFETWLVNVVDQVLGTNPDQAQDDTFEVTPLVGWNWGFTTKSTDDGDVDPYEFEDFFTESLPFDFLGETPSPSWKAALGYNYGIGANQDKFNIGLRAVDSQPRAAAVPEPASALGLLAFGALSVTMLKRKQNQ